jgi:hypothetical protein
MFDFFKFAVIGPTAAHRLGIASGCAECRQHQAQPPQCDGFGGGCLGFRGVAPQPAPEPDPDRKP